VTLTLPKARVYGAPATRAVSPMLPLSTSGRIFLAGGQPWRWKGVSAFKLCELFRQGRLADIDAILADFAGFNLLRVWDYVPWPGRRLGVARRGRLDRLPRLRARARLDVELTLLTDDARRASNRRSGWCRRSRPPASTTSCSRSATSRRPTRKSTRTRSCRRAGERLPLQLGRLRELGVLARDVRHGAHRAHVRLRRRAHDLMEYFNGGGPNRSVEPACRAPWVGDEPGEAAGRARRRSPDKVRGWRALFGAASLLGAGGDVPLRGRQVRRAPDVVTSARSRPPRSKG
jgi:hypothetical protein